jgi:hypothetical protein
VLNRKANSLCDAQLITVGGCYAVHRAKSQAEGQRLTIKKRRLRKLATYGPATTKGTYGPGACEPERKERERLALERIEERMGRNRQ